MSSHTELQGKKTIKVAVSPFEPMVIKKGNEYSGFEVELWEKIAKEMGVRFSYESYAFPELLSALGTGKADVALGGITKTLKREKYLDFSHDILDSGLRILVTNHSHSTIFTAIRVLFTSEMRKIIAGLLGFVAVAAHFIWAVERGAGSISEKYFPGILESFWWGIVTVSTVGYGDFVLQTWGGRAIGSVVILIGLAIFGLYVGQVSSLITLRRLESSGINGPEDLRNKSVITQKGTTGVKALERLGAKITLVDNISDAFTKLMRGGVQAVVFDSPVILHYANNEGLGKTHIIGGFFEEQSYGITFSEGSPLREPVNRALLKLKESGVYDDLHQKWFGD